MTDKFSDPILWPNDTPIPINLKHLEIVSRGQFEKAEMAAFDELPATLRKLISQHNVNVCLQLVAKGLKFGEFTEDQVYLEFIKRTPRPWSGPMQSRQAS